MRKLILGILYLGLFILPVFGLWFAFVLTTDLWGVGHRWASVLVAAVSIPLFAVWWRFGGAAYLGLFREFLEFLKYDVLGLMKTGAASMDESHLHSIFGYGNRSILCDGAGTHYIQFAEYNPGGLTYRTEPHFTTCDTWWTDCRSWKEPPDGKTLSRIIIELLRRVRIIREKHDIRQTVWFWRYYSEDEARSVVLCNNPNCERLFILPHERIVLLTEPKDHRRLIPRLFTHVGWHLEVFIWTTPYRGYAVHYDCLPEALKGISRD